MRSGGAPTTDARATILLVEDNRLVRETLSATLDALGYRVIAAERGETARATLAGPEPIDLLFTDLVLPGSADGVELARIARASRPRIRILISSGLAADALADRAGRERGDEFLMKPYDFDELRAALCRLLGR